MIVYGSNSNNDIFLKIVIVFLSEKLCSAVLNLIEIAKRKSKCNLATQKIGHQSVKANVASSNFHNYSIIYP